MHNLASGNNNNHHNRFNMNNRNNIQIRRNHNNAYRNELYDRTSGYDVPRPLLRGNYGHSTGPMKRRTNVNLDLNSGNRSHYHTMSNRGHRQRSFDDTESYHYANSNNGYRCENIYEQIREEPAYRNVSIATDRNGGRIYGRLDVIGHGIGRIERHLSSSCGNIDHYNLGGHYAVLGHSHLGTVGHIRLNAGNAPNNPKETGGKSLNIFSCLGRENSQSMNNIYRASSANGGNSSSSNNNNNSNNGNINIGNNSNDNTASSHENHTKSTGAIPKAKNRVSPKIISPAAVHSTTFNRIPKSSLQWLLVNKWLPLWVGERSECNVLDFNFMFSRNCDGCGGATLNPLYLEENIGVNNYGQYDGGRYASAARQLANSNLQHLHHNDPRYFRYDNFSNDRSRINHNAQTYPQNISENHNRFEVSNDPFRRWELNSENNSFRPAQSVRRITDGTFPNNSQRQTVRIQINHIETNESPQPSTSASQLSTMPAVAQNNTMNEPQQQQVRVNNAPGSSKNASSPEPQNRRYSEHTEDDQDTTSKSESIETDDYSEYDNINSEGKEEHEEVEDDVVADISEK